MAGRDCLGLKGLSTGLCMPLAADGSYANALHPLAGPAADGAATPVLGWNWAPGTWLSSAHTDRVRMLVLRSAAALAGE